ncbi:hypothetical protein SAMN05216338_104751 [Bradyrhizobium sp. Rc2d]|nr:hypothetical protein SAMN05216338_104751 [Bradyrhizobium sp. Rc2d]
MKMPVSYKDHIYSLFRDFDRKSMFGKFDLWRYDDVKKWADTILDKVENGLMPCDAAWPDKNVQLLKQWIADGKLP